MKNKLLLGSTLLASAFMLNVPSAMAAPIAPPAYTSQANANAQKSFDSGPTSASAFGPMTHSRASVNGFELHSYSEVYDIDILPDTAFAATEEEGPQGRFLQTSGHASFNQRFNVLSAGLVTFRFDWDGMLYSDGTYSAGFNFNGDVSSSTQGFLGGARDNDSVGGGTATINQFSTFNVVFGASDIGSTVDVNASLSTFAGDNLREARLIESLFEPLVSEFDPRSAYADFENTGIFSFTGQGIIAPAAVPVPAAVWLFGSALFGLFGMKRKAAA